MADWAKPTITSNYVTFVDEVKNRDIDAITLQLNALTNPPTGSIRLLRSPVKFQEWDGAAFVDRVLSPAGGGTGATSLSGLGPSMGLGSMAYVNTSGFSVGPGSIASLTLTGNTTANGGAFIINTTAGVNALTVNGNSSAYALVVVSPTSPSNGIYIKAGTGSPSEYALIVQNANATLNGFYVRGDMAMIIPNRLVIPVGTDLWAS